jgi:hypothetical protein
VKEYYNIKGREYYLREKENISIKGKKRYNKNKKENIQKIKELLSEMNSIFSELDLPVYGTIYKFENIKTGRVYIGQTIKPFHRRYQLNPIVAWIKERKEKKNQKFLEELIEEDFIYTEILDYGICKWHLDKLEMYYIDKYNSCENGYNNCAGNHETDDGIEEFNEILEKYNLEFIDNELRRK